MKRLNVVKNENQENSFESPFVLYCKKVSRYKNLSSSEEKELIRLAFQGDKSAKTKLIQANLKLVVNIAKKTIHKSDIPILDLIQEGNLALIAAFDKFNPKLGYRFSTYASWWIKQAMFKAISEQGYCMKIPVYVQETLSKYRKIKNRIEITYGIQIKNNYAADIIGIKEDKIDTFLNAFTKSLSIENSMDSSDDKLSLSEIIEDVKQNVEKEVESKELKKEIRQALKCLKEKEQKVITLRFGLDDNNKKTLEEIGSIYGVTKECIRQIEKKAIKKIYENSEINNRLKGFVM